MQAVTRGHKDVGGNTRGCKGTQAGTSCDENRDFQSFEFPLSNSLKSIFEKTGDHYFVLTTHWNQQLEFFHSLRFWLIK